MSRKNKCARRARTASSGRANLLFRPTKIMISPLVSKVNNPPILLSSLSIAIALRRKPLLLLEGFLPPGHWARCVCEGATRVPLGMSSIHPECLDSDPSDRSVAADVLLRQEPDEEEDEAEDEGDGKEDDDDDDEGDGYSE